MPRIIRGTKVGFFAVVLLTGCMTQGVWSYKVEPHQRTEPVLDKSVAVLPFTDLRGTVNKNKLALAMLPLMPFGWQNLETPERAQPHVSSGGWLFRPSEDLAKATAQELNNAGIFQEVFYSHRAGEGDWVLRGEIRSTSYKGKRYAYGLSCHAPLLWVFGLPAATTSNELAITLRLQDSSTNRVIWSASLSDDIKSTSYLYAMKPDFRYDVLLKNVLSEALPSLRRAVARERF